LDVDRISTPKALHVKAQLKPRATPWESGRNNPELAMPQSLAAVYVHLIYSTKNRQR